MSVNGIGSFVRERRDLLGWTQEHLSERTGISRARIAQIEGGRVALPNADVRRSLAKALGVSHLDILVAAGEITRDELDTTIGKVEFDMSDPKQRLHQAIDSTPMTEDRLIGLLQMLAVWRESARRAGRTT